MFPAMASDADGLEDEIMRRSLHSLDWVDQKVDEMNVRLSTLSDNIKVCDAVLDDLQALKEIQARKSLQDACAKPEKETEEPLPKTST